MKKKLDSKQVKRQEKQLRTSLNSLKQLSLNSFEVVDGNLVLMASCSKAQLDTLKQNFGELDHKFKTEFYWDGLQVTDRVNEVLYQPSKLKFLKPISALLIDYQMPIKNGL